MYYLLAVYKYIYRQRHTETGAERERKVVWDRRGEGKKGREDKERRKEEQKWWRETGKERRKEGECRP